MKTFRGSLWDFSRGQPAGLILCHASSNMLPCMGYGFIISALPSGYVKIAIENHHRNSGYLPTIDGDVP